MRLVKSFVFILSPKETCPMNCKNCQQPSVKKGVRNSKQKYYCKICNKYFQASYRNKLCTKLDDEAIVKLNNEGVGISSIGRLLGISKSNVCNRISKIAKSIAKPLIGELKQEYEVDEMYTFIKSKVNSCYIIYAINKKTKAVIDFSIGPRNKKNISKVISTVLEYQPQRIFTDRLNIYPSLIVSKKHVASAYKINHIERYNLTLRTHLKRLCRKTICFSRSISMLENCLRIYFWDDQSEHKKVYI
jgi:insertion element IS1 protein InsB